MDRLIPLSWASSVEGGDKATEGRQPLFPPALGLCQCSGGPGLTKQGGVHVVGKGGHQSANKIADKARATELGQWTGDGISDLDFHPRVLLVEVEQTVLDARLGPRVAPAIRSHALNC